LYESPQRGRKGTDAGMPSGDPSPYTDPVSPSVNDIRVRFEISDTGEDLESLPCLLSIELARRPFLRIGEGARAFGVPDEDTSYSLFALYEGLQGLLLTLLAEHRETANAGDPQSAPLFLADCGADCCGAQDFSVLHREAEVVLRRTRTAEEHRVDAAAYSEAVLNAVAAFLDFVLADARQRDEEAWSLYDQLGWLARKVAADGISAARGPARAFLEAAESKVEAATRVRAVAGTH
jgi:hypothetical protein